MRSSFFFAPLTVGALLIFGCGSPPERPTVSAYEPTSTTGSPGNETLGSETTPSTSTTGPEQKSSDLAEDHVAFQSPGSDTVLEMHLDGTDLRPHVISEEPHPVWPNQTLMLSRLCGNESGSAERTFVVMSADGATLGSSDSEWSPVWSPDRKSIAVACAGDESSDIVLVGEDEMAGDRPDWSRDSRAELSDQVDIKITNIEGSRIRNLTYSEIASKTGDWLPQWSLDGRFIVFESNRHGNSEIYVAEIGSTAILRLTDHEARDQTPVWSRENKYIVFASDRSGTFELYAIAQHGGNVFPLGQAGRAVPWNR